MNEPGDPIRGAPRPAAPASVLALPALPRHVSAILADAGRATPAPAATDPTDAPAEAPHDLRWYLHPRPLFSGGNRVRLLRGGDELFPAMCEAIDAARDEIWLAMYIFHHDETAHRVALALAAAAQRGVRVHVVVDGFGSKAALDRLEQWWAGCGVRLTVFRPVESWRALFQPEHLRRLHLKLCVVDGERGYVGGINVIDDRLDLRHGPTDAPRLDFAVELVGPVVIPVAQTAQAVWQRARLGQDWSHQMLALLRSRTPFARARELLQGVRIVAGDSMLADTPDAPVRAAFAVRDNLRHRRTIERSYVEAFERARRRIDIASPYFYPGREFRRTLREAVRRGVRVRLLLQGKIDYRIAGMAARSLYAELMSRGVQIYEYTPAYLHAKVALADDDWATVGSSNIDPLSLLLNLEANVVVRDRAFSAELAADFERALASSREVRLPGLGGGWWAALQRAVVAWTARLYLRLAGFTGKY